MRVSVGVDDLEPAVGPAGGGATGARGPGDGRAGSGTGRAAEATGSRSRSSAIGSLQLERARTVASSLDLRGARVDEALEALNRYLDDASLAGLDQVLIIHGLGTGALRDAVRANVGAHPLVKSFRAGERGEGGDGATIVKL
jgi:DNA mismatch repair protein MutS2